MDNDDLPVGRLLSRREALLLFGAAGATFLAACSTGDDSDDPAPTATQAASDGATSTSAGQASPTSVAEATATATDAATDPTATNGTSATSEATQAATATATTEAAATATSETAVIPACIVVPELTEGPYFVDERLDRSDIRSDPATGTLVEGATLELTFRVSQISGAGCVAYPGAVVDIWHCDALGVYSDVSDAGFNTVGQQFLRGYQVTDENGSATFTTIYPGWYQGRAVHIHFKVRSEVTDDSALEFTSQFFFDDAFSDEIFLQEPYASKGERDTFNDNDGIYGQSDGLLTLTCTPTTDGYSATFDIGVQSA